jgi:signal peptidase
MKILKTIYCIALGCLTVIAILLIISVFPITGNIKFMTVLSGSMEPTIKTGSVVITKPVSDYKIGDIITFGPYSKTQAPVTHRISDIRVQGGEPVYITKGDANDAPDTREIAKKDIVGKVLFSVPFVGYAVDFARKPVGFILIIAVPALAIICDEIRKIWKEISSLKNKKKDAEQDTKIEKLEQEIGKIEDKTQ